VFALSKGKSRCKIDGCIATLIALARVTAASNLGKTVPGWEDDRATD
jgi:hypothetical protein